MPVAFFRFYASAWRGAGHAFRCMTLAQALQEKGWACHFITEKESYEFVSALSLFPRLDPDVFFEKPQPCDLLVVDHYGCGFEYEQHLRPYASRILVIDDLADRAHDCDIVHDQTYGRLASEYEKDVPADCMILTGADYALLRPQFQKLRPQALERRSKTDYIARILVNFGGNDQQNNILDTLQALAAIDYRGAIDVVYGVLASHKKQVEEYAATMANDISFHINPDMAQLMLRADLAVGASGTTTWERCCLGLPTILIETADNQRTIIQNLCRDQAVVGVGLECLSHDGLVINFDRSFYQDCVGRTAIVSDGHGVGRLVSAIEKKRQHAIEFA